MTRPQYTAVCRRSGKWWAIEVPQVPGVHSQARRLDQVEATAREAVALLLDVAPDSFDVAVDAHLPNALDCDVRELRRMREQADAMAADAAVRARRAAVALADAGLPLRDIGIALGVSHQRVAQLLAKPRTGPVPSTRQAATTGRIASSGS